MAVRIRLTRTGRRHVALWRVAVYDARTRRDGKYLEMLGTYDPTQKPEHKFKIDADRYRHWVSAGARPSPALERLLKHARFLEAAPK
ncbi:MAG: 30S ribosomal protein S16 [Planctomycetes bacterium]|nr:30S ribosomal protein S16 [Planctomycetota bacterium]